MDLMLLLLRLVVGTYLFAHGAQKAFGWFGGPGLARTLGQLRDVMGFRPHLVWGLALILGETVGGVLLVLGLLSPLGALAVAATMLSATIQHWSNGPWGQRGGYELPLTNMAVAIALAVTGPGAQSLDAWLGVNVPVYVSQVVAVVLFGAALASQLTRRRPQPTASEQPAQA